MRRRLAKSIFKKLIWPLLAVLAFGVQQKFFDNENILVVKVYDGDTVQLINGQKVRLIGIDTPETHEGDKLFRDAKRSGQDIETIKALGRQSAAFTRQLLLGKSVALDFDAQHNDKYGRVLAYVWLPRPSVPDSVPPENLVVEARQKKDGSKEDYVFVNATIIKAGYAQTMTIAPNVRYARMFQELAAQAQEQKQGLWSVMEEPVRKTRKPRSKVRD